MAAVINGWTVYAHPCFQGAYDALVAQVAELQERLPDSYQGKKEAKLLAIVHHVIEQGITVDPASDAYDQGSMSGNKYLKWFRAKFGAGRYRLFFRYNVAKKIIVLGWMNNVNTLRTYNSKTDSYEVFKKMLRKEKPPTAWDDLLNEASEGDLPERFATAFQNAPR